MRIDIRRNSLWRGCVTLEQVAREVMDDLFLKCCMSVGWDFEQSDLGEGVPACGRVVDTRWSLMSLPIQNIL